MKKRSTILLAIVSASCALFVMDRLQAQPESAKSAKAKARPTSVGVADVVEILAKYQRVQDVRKTFESRTKDLKAKRDALTKDIESDKKFLRDEFKPNTPDYEKQFTKIREKLIRLKIWEEVQAGQNDRDQYVATLGLQKEVLAAISEEAKLRGLDLVLHNPISQDRGGTSGARAALKIHALLYATEEIDLTDMVLKKLNDKYKKRAGK